MRQKTLRKGQFWCFFLVSSMEKKPSTNKRENVLLLLEQGGCMFCFALHLRERVQINNINKNYTKYYVCECRSTADGFTLGSCCILGLKGKIEGPQFSEQHSNRIQLNSYHRLGLKISIGLWFTATFPYLSCYNVLRWDFSCNIMLCQLHGSLSLVSQASYNVEILRTPTARAPSMRESVGCPATTMTSSRKRTLHCRVRKHHTLSK